MRQIGGAGLAAHWAFKVFHPFVMSRDFSNMLFVVSIAIGESWVEARAILYDEFWTAPGRLRCRPLARDEPTGLI